MEKDSIIVLSGGMDSVTLMHEYKEQIALAVTFDYGSNHNKREIECAAYQCLLLGIKHLVIPLEFMARYFKSSLLEGADAIPEGHYADDNMRSTVVPFRNGIMLSVACGLAESYGLKHVMIANHSGDHAIYPDCRPEFTEAMERALALCHYYPIGLERPFVGMTKADIVRLGADLGVDFSLTWSCYKGGEKHCGKCGTCVERREAFKLAGVPDPTEYLG